MRSRRTSDCFKTQQWRGRCVDALGGAGGPDSSGDKDALSALYDASSGQVFGLILRIVGDRAVAEEIALDVYVQVWRGAASYDPARGSATAWLLLLARSRAIDYLRSKAGQTRGREQALPEEYRQVADRSPNPEAAAEADSRRTLIDGALGGLDPDKRQAIELAFFGGLSHSEISDHLGLPIGTKDAHSNGDAAVAGGFGATGRSPVIGPGGDLYELAALLTAGASDPTKRPGRFGAWNRQAKTFAAKRAALRNGGAWRRRRQPETPPARP